MSTTLEPGVRDRSPYRQKLQAYAGHTGNSSDPFPSFPRTWEGYQQARAHRQERGGSVLPESEAKTIWKAHISGQSVEPTPEPTVGTGKKASEVAAKIGTRKPSDGGNLTYAEATLVSRFDPWDRGEAEKQLGGGFIDLYLDSWIIEAKEKPTRGAVEHVEGTLRRRVRDAEFVLEFVGIAALFGSRPSDDDIEFLHENDITVIYEDENGIFHWVRP